MARIQPDIQHDDEESGLIKSLNKRIATTKSAEKKLLLEFMLSLEHGKQQGQRIGMGNE